MYISETTCYAVDGLQHTYTQMGGDILYMHRTRVHTLPIAGYIKTAVNRGRGEKKKKSLISPHNPHSAHIRPPPHSLGAKLTPGRRTGGEALGGQHYRKTARPHATARVKCCQQHWDHSSTGLMRALPVTSRNKRITATTNPWLCTPFWNWEHWLQLWSGRLSHAFAAQMNGGYFHCHFWWLFIITQMPSGNYFFYLWQLWRAAERNISVSIQHNPSVVSYFAEQLIKPFTP